MNNRNNHNSDTHIRSIAKEVLDQLALGASSSSVSGYDPDALAQLEGLEYDINVAAVAPDIVADLQRSVIVSGVSTGGTPISLIDNTKDFEVDSLLGKILKFNFNSIEYYREIFGNTLDEIFFTPLELGSFSTAVVGDISAGQITIVATTVGDFNHYTVEFVAGVGSSVPLSAAFVGGTGVLTVTLATDINGDLITMDGNFATDIAFAIDALPEFTATMTGAGGVMGETVTPIAFTGGVDPIILSSETHYQIIDNQISPIITTITQGLQRTKIVDDLNNVISATNNALDINIKTVSLPDTIIETNDLGVTLFIPHTAGLRLLHGTAAIQLRSTDLSANTTFFLEFSVDQLYWDGAEENGTVVSDILVANVPKVFIFEAMIGLYWRLRFQAGSTGTITYHAIL